MRPFIASTIILFFTGCASLSLLVHGFEKPRFSYTGCTLVEADRKQAVVHVTFTAHNPNSAGVSGVLVSYELFSKGMRIMHGEDLPLTLIPKGDTNIDVPVLISYADLLPVLDEVVKQLLDGKKTMPIRIKAVFTGSPAIITEGGQEDRLTFTITEDRTVDLPLPLDQIVKGLRRLRI